MTQTIAIAAGGALGALLRYWMSTYVYSILGRGFPYGTLVVNILGSLLMGYLFIVLVERMASDAVWRAALLIGVLGAFTTFSTFSIETVNLIEDGAYIKALANVFLSAVLCIMAAWVGVLAGRY